MTVSVLSRDLLFHELDLQVRTTRQLLAKIDPAHFSFRPHESMRTLHELATHLVQIPAVDLAILQEKDEISIRQLEADLTPKEKEDFIRILEQGTHALKTYMEALDEHTFFYKKATTFYGYEVDSQAKWLLEVITHLTHHRAQLFNYLKQLEYDVQMYDLY